MTNSPLQIEYIKVKDVYDFICDMLDRLEPGETVPISRSRAQAWANNPNAAEDDVGLIVAFQDNRCAGYLGLLPGLLHTRDGLKKTYWFSTWYVPEQFRQTGVGAALMLRALALQRDIVVTNISDQAGQVYQRLRFKPLGPLNYLVADFNRFDLLSLPLRAIRRLARKFGAGQKESLDRLIDSSRRLYKKPLYLALLAATSYQRQQVKTRPVAQITDRSFEAEQNADVPVRFFRGANVINWMLEYPWVVTDPQQGTSGYYFRDCQPFFRFIALEIYGKGDGRYKGFVVLRVNNKHANQIVTVFDYHFHEPKDQRCLLALAVEQGHTFLADRIIVPDVCRQEIEQSSFMRWLFRKAQRTYYCYPNGPSSPLGCVLDQIKLDLSDGDIAFA